MSTQGKQPLELRIREYRGRQIQQGWLEELSQACRTLLTRNMLLPLQETEEQKRKFFERVRHGPAQRLFWRGNESTQVIATLHSIKEQFSAEVILFSEVDYEVGAVKLSSDFVLEHALEVWKVVKEDLSFATTSLEDGLCLELNEYGRDKQEYELTTWGQFLLVNTAHIGGTTSSQYSG